MENAGAHTNNPVKDSTPRQGGGLWWIILLVLLLAGGLFWAFGRSNGENTEAIPAGAPAARIAPADQIHNTVRADGAVNDTERTVIEDDRDRLLTAPTDTH